MKPFMPGSIPYFRRYEQELRPFPGVSRETILRPPKDPSMVMSPASSLTSLSITKVNPSTA